jgi:hypothetical protein
MPTSAHARRGYARDTTGSAECRMLLSLSKIVRRSGRFALTRMLRPKCDRPQATESRNARRRPERRWARVPFWLCGRVSVAGRFCPAHSVRTANWADLG